MHELSHPKQIWPRYGRIGLLLFALLGWGLWWNASQVQTNHLQRVVPEPTPLPTKPLQWSDLESEEDQEWVQRLKDFGCPDPIIQNILAGKMRQEMLRRMQEIWTPKDMIYWKSGVQALAGLIPDPEVERRLKEIQEEYLESFIRLFPTSKGLELTLWPDLGFAWEPALVFLPEEKRKDLLAQEQEWSRQFLLQTWSRDPFGAASEDFGNELELEKERFIQEHFSQSEQFEYRLRFSPQSQLLRWDLLGFEPSREEFRLLFAFYQTFPELVGLKGEAWQQPALNVQREKLKSILGLERFESFLKCKEPGFRSFYQEISSLKFSTPQALEVYDVFRVISDELNPLQQDKSIEHMELKRILLRLKQETYTELRRILGNEGFERYFASSQGAWLRNMFLVEPVTDQEASTPQ